MINTSCTHTPAGDATGSGASSTRTGPRSGWRRAVLSSVAAALTATTGLLAIGGTAGAEALPTNALAPQVVMTANEAIASLDEFAVTGDPVDFLEYKDDRTETARLAAQQLGYGEVDMIRAWSSTPLDHQRAVLAAMSQVGVPYRTHTSEEGVGFDCSGLTTYAWAKAGVELFRQSGTQINEAAPLDRLTAKAGDLVYYPGHVMLYLGVGDAIIHSVQRGRTVEIDTISGRRVNSVRFGDPAPDLTP
ncbi:MAG: NlpC/P60 family protein [Ilumatobacteraceae bacterium]